MDILLMMWLVIDMVLLMILPFRKNVTKYENVMRRRTIENVKSLSVMDVLIKIFLLFLVGLIIHFFIHIISDIVIQKVFEWYRGIFIVEVKNYSGSLMGTDNDYEWVKTKTSSSGNSYTKIVKNPIKQVNRQVYLLAQFLKYYGVDVWVEGYTFFVQGNSPVDCKQVLESAQDINHVIHNGANRNLTNAKVQEIQKLLS